MSVVALCGQMHEWPYSEIHFSVCAGRIVSVVTQEKLVVAVRALLRVHWSHYEDTQLPFHHIVTESVGLHLFILTSLSVLFDECVSINPYRVCYVLPPLQQVYTLGSACGLLPNSGFLLPSLTRLRTSSFSPFDAAFRGEDLPSNHRRIVSAASASSLYFGGLVTHALPS